MKGARASAKRRSLAFRLVRALLATVACLYLLVAAAIWYGQTKILYHPRKILDVTPADLGLKFEAVRLPLNGDWLAGRWLTEPRSASDCAGRVHATRRPRFATACQHRLDRVA
jgi:hypothetical protein